MPIQNAPIPEDVFSEPSGTAPARNHPAGVVLVTGAAGLVGCHLVRSLSAQGRTVRALYHREKPAEDLQLPGVIWMQGDLLDVYRVEEVMEGVDEVYHCAAVVSFHPGDKSRMLHVNVESTANTVNGALDAGVRKLLYVSSVAALGRSEESREITEEEQWEESKYNSAYGLSKHLAELEVWRGHGEGLEVVIVNPGIVLGGGNFDTGSARLMKVVDREFPFYTQGVNGWVDAEDLVTIMMRLMDSDLSGERFIVSAGNFSYREVFTEMARALGKKPPHISASPWMTAIIWRLNALKTLLTGKRTTITRETARNAQKVVHYDNSKLLRCLPDFAYRPLAETVRKMADAYQRRSS